MGNKEILDTVKSALCTPKQYSLQVDYDAEGNPVFRVAPTNKFTVKKK